MKNIDLKNIVSRLILIDIQDPNFLTKFPFAGYILFYKDVDHSPNGWLKLKEMNEHYVDIFEKKFGVDVFRSVDQEGGVVFRFDYPDFPAVCSQSSINNESDAYLVAKFNGLILKYLGFNLNFSPVMDVNTNNENPIIGVRSFGNDSHKVSIFSKMYIRAYNEVNILCTGKHFPGHGDTNVDSHLDLPVSTLTDEHLYPFIFNKSILPSIMSAHVVYENVDNFPATMSKKVLDLYQPYDGLIFSDALNMKALKNFKWEDVLLNSLYAGIDVLLILGDDELKMRSIEFLADRAEKDLQFRELVFSKCQKINRFLKRLKKLENYESILEELKKLKKWMFNDYEIPIIQKGNEKIFKSFFTSDLPTIFILSSNYIKLIGINQKIESLLRSFFGGKFNNINFVEILDPNQVDNVIKSVDFKSPVLVCYLVMDNSYQFFIDKLGSLNKDVFVLSFSNPFIRGDYVVNIGGFSEVHLLNLTKWLSKFVEGINRIEIV
ncbi:MAG: glycoside hydrolase family 3 N-terminal domain-containing protein [Candidatus Calescibacterium sp.]|nr:hypothetical protein [Candidatus Calescibacterium sp.]MDW8132612.1 glycoside hydrolase family 3 N-terminal domain-containing protein [Candidatus Calescibacterium sp.]